MYHDGAEWYRQRNQRRRRTRIWPAIAVLIVLPGILSIVTIFIIPSMGVEIAAWAMRIL